MGGGHSPNGASERPGSPPEVLGPICVTPSRDSTRKTDPRAPPPTPGITFYAGRRTARDPPLEPRSMLGTESLDEPFRLRVMKLTSTTLTWAKPRPNHVFQTPPVFLPTVSALMVQVSRPHLNQRTATCDANFDRRRRSAGCPAPGVCALDVRGLDRGV